MCCIAGRGGCAFSGHDAVEVSGDDKAVHVRDGSVIQGVPDKDGEVFVVSPRRYVGREEGVRVAVRGAYLESVKLSWDRRSGPRASRRRMGP